MADILKSLLTSYYNDIETQSQAGGALDFVRSSYIIQNPELIPPDLSTTLPCVLISFGLVPIEPFCVPMIHDKKIYNITISVIKQGYNKQTLDIIGDAYETGIIDMMSAIETRYRRQTFGLSDIVNQSQIDYTLLRIPPFLDQTTAQGHITFMHDYIDMRA
jgi:hypothetical protein